MIREPLGVVSVKLPWTSAVSGDVNVVTSLVSKVNWRRGAVPLPVPEFAD